MNVCGVCGFHEREREFLPLDEVIFANGLVVPACASCWLRWPDEHKRRARDAWRFPKPSTAEVLELLRETA